MAMAGRERSGGTGVLHPEGKLIGRDHFHMSASTARK